MKKVVWGFLTILALISLYFIGIVAYGVGVRLKMANDYSRRKEALVYSRPLDAPTPTGGSPVAVVPVSNVTSPEPPPPVTNPNPVKTANLLPWPFSVTSSFGHYPDGGAHYGIDVGRTYGVIQTFPIGGTITEAEGGCVAQAAQEMCNKGWGNHIWWKTDDNTLGYANGVYVLLRHFSKDPTWKVGDRVEAGQEAGVTGATGWANGPHVHFQVNPSGMGNPGSVNPAWVFPWLREKDTDPVPGDRFGASK